MHPECSDVRPQDMTPVEAWRCVSDTVSSNIDQAERYIGSLTIGQWSDMLGSATTWVIVAFFMYLVYRMALSVRDEFRHANHSGQHQWPEAFKWTALLIVSAVFATSAVHAYTDLNMRLVGVAVVFGILTFRVGLNLVHHRRRKHESADEHA